MTQTTTRRDLLRIGTSAAAYAAGAAIVTGGVALASEAKGTTGVSPKLSALIATYRRAWQAYDHHCNTVSEPAQDVVFEGRAKAIAAVPHVEMTLEMKWADGVMSPRHMTSANAMDVRHAEFVAGTKHEPASNWTADQHRHFAQLRQFNTARLERDKAVAAAVAKVEADDGGALARATDNENELWDVCAAARDAVVEAVPTSLADLSAKLAFYAESHAIDGHDALLFHIRTDLAQITTDVAHVAAGEAQS